MVKMMVLGRPGGHKWYTNLGDMVFWLSNPVNGGKDVFWQSRDNALLIKVL